MHSSCEWQLYVIIDQAAVGTRDLAEVAAAAIRGGADAIQVRDKTAPITALKEHAQRLLPLTQAAGVPLIVNDYAEVAHAVGAQGVHLGQDDGPVSAARHLVGQGSLIGKSTHSLEQALAARREGADYIGLGPIFPTPTKPDYASVGLELISDVMARVKLPVVCIGGIDRTTLPQVLEAGARCVAVVRAVCAAADPEAATRALKETIRQFARSPSASTL